MKQPKQILVEKQDVSAKPAPSLPSTSEFREDVKSFTTKSDAWGIRQVASDYLLITLMVCIIYSILQIDIPIFLVLMVTLVAQIFIAGALKGLNNLVHEACHGTLFETKAWNDNAQSLFCFLVFRDLDSYRTFHNLHHKYLNTENDPENAYKTRWLLNDIRANFWTIVFFRTISLYYTYDFIRYSVIPFWTNGIRTLEKIWFWTTILLAVSILNAWLIFSLGLVIPLFVIYPVLVAGVEATEHINLTGKSTDPTGGRNRFYHPLLESILLRHSDGPHGLHHVLPQISGRQMKRAYKFLKEKYGLPFIEATSIKETMDQMLDPE